MADIIKCIRAAVSQGVIDAEDGKHLEQRVAEIKKLAKSDTAIKEALAKELGAEAAERNRRALLSEQVRKKIVDTLHDYRNARGEADLAEAFVRMHENFGRDGGSFVADAENLRSVIQRGAHAELADLLIAFRKGAWTGDLRRKRSAVAARMDNVAREMHGEKTGDTRAEALANAFRDVAEKLRLRFNEAGGAIGKLDNWFPHSHDMQALLDYSRDPWIDYMMTADVLDRERMVNTLTQRQLTDAELRESLGVVWDRITTDGWIDREASGVSTGKGALWSQHADHRYLHFKSADAWLKYAREFGNPDPYTAIVGHINMMARDIAHMETFGPNPNVTRNYMKQYLTQQAALVKPMQIVAREQGEKMKGLAARLTSANPDYVALSERMADVSRSLAELKARASVRDRKLDAERTAIAKRLRDLDATEWRNISPVGRTVLEELAAIDRPAAGLSLEQTIEVKLAQTGASESAIRFVLGDGSTFREPGGLIAANRERAAAMRRRARELLNADNVVMDMTRRLDEITTQRLKQATHDATDAKLHASLVKEHADIAAQLVPFWNDPKLQTVEDHQVRLAMEALAEEMRDPVQFAPHKKPQQYLAVQIDRADGMWENMRGSLSPVNASFANVMASTRNLISASSLGAAWLSSLSDPAFGQDARMRFGMGMARANFGRVLIAVLRDMVTHGTREDAIRAGLGLDSAIDVMHRTARQNRTIDGRAWTGFAADRVLSIGLLSPWTQAGKHRFGLDVMAFMADLRDTAWVDLAPQTRSALQAHGFDLTAWETIRLSDIHEPKSGATYLRPAEIEAWAGRELAERYAAMVLRETRYAVPESTVASRSVLNRTRPGTTLGEIMRSGVQFKGFGIAVAQLHAGRIAREMLRGDKGAASQAAALLVTSAFLGAVAMSLKDIKDGRDPRKWLDEKTYIDPAFWGAAALQAGGLGIYGDFLFSNTGRHGQSLASALAGPAAQRADNLLGLATGNLFQKMRGENTNFGREATRALRQNIPGNNLWFTGLVFQRVLMDQLQRLVDPEAQAAFNRQMQVRSKDYKQQFWWPPGETAPRRGPDLSRILATR